MAGLAFGFSGFSGLSGQPGQGFGGGGGGGPFTNSPASVGNLGSGGLIIVEEFY
jgi:hypothetical protein